MHDDSDGRGSFSDYLISGGRNIASIYELLSTENVLLEQFFDDDELIPLIANHNEKLIEYLATYQNVSTILGHLLSKIDANQNDEKVLYKYPYIASEIFGIECPEILNIFFLIKNESGSLPLVDELLLFLENADKNTLVTSFNYFSKCIISLARFKSKDFFSYLYSTQKFKYFYTFLDIKPVADALSHILIFDSLDKLTWNEEPYAAERLEMLNLVIELLIVASDHLLNENASLIIIDFIESQTKSMHFKNLLFFQLFSEELIKKLFNTMLKLERNTESIANIFTKIGLFYKEALKNIESKSPNSAKNETISSSVLYDQGFKEIVEKNKQNFEFICSLYVAPICRLLLKKNTTNYDSFLSYFGICRYNLLEMLLMFASVDSAIIFQKFMQTNIFYVLLSVIIEYPNNSIAHHCILKFLKIYFNSNKNNELIQHFQENALNLEHLLTFIEKTKNQQGKCTCVEILKLMNEYSIVKLEETSYKEGQAKKIYDREIFDRKTKLGDFDPDNPIMRTLSAQIKLDFCETTPDSNKNENLSPYDFWPNKNVNENDSPFSATYSDNQSPISFSLRIENNGLDQNKDSPIKEMKKI